MKTHRGVVAGRIIPGQHSDSIAVRSVPLVESSTPNLEFPRPLGAVPVRLGPYLEHESRARGHLLQLVIDAASIPAERRPAGLELHLTRLWRAIESLLFTTPAESSHARRLIDPAGVAACRATAAKFLAGSSEPRGPAA